MTFVCLKSLIERGQKYVNLRARTLLLGVFLVGCAIGGMPIRPDEIEQHMRTMSQAEVVQVLEEGTQFRVDPPPADLNL